MLTSNRSSGAIRQVPALACLLVAACVAPADDSGTADISLQVAINDDGTSTALWADGIAISIGESAAAELISESTHLSFDAQAWLWVLEHAMPEIRQRGEEVAELFGVQPIDATIVVGNRGSSDGFGWVPDHIGINVQAFADSYGPPNEDSLDRMVRIVAHEYLHLLTYARYPNHRELRQTPFDRALWTIFFEGIGDYISMSQRWLPDQQGNYSPTAAETLRRLEPVMVDRLERLANADDDAEKSLRANIAMGKFDQKWGSLPFALWLQSETARCGEAETLQRIIALERDGVLPLAFRYSDEAVRPGIRRLASKMDRSLGELHLDICLAEQMP